MHRSRRSRSVHDLEVIYEYNKRLSKSHHRYIHMIENATRIGSQVDWRQQVRMEKVRLEMSRMKLKRHDQIFKIFSQINRKKSSTSDRTAEQQNRSGSMDGSKISGSPRTSTTEHSGRQTSSSVSSMLVIKIVEQENGAIIDMHPNYQSTELDPNEEIVYPNGVTDLRPYQTIARFRKSLGKIIDFINEPIAVGDDKCETLILGLDHFTRNHGCQLIFTNDEHKFIDSIYRAACGTADLGSVHLLATDTLLTAMFNFEFELEPANDPLKSKTKIRTFVEQFCHRISIKLSCDINFLRIFSINRLDSNSKKFRVRFGLTTTDYLKTQNLAKNLQKLIRIGFPNDTILESVVGRFYQYELQSKIKYFQLNPHDLASDQNLDYRSPWVSVEEKRGGHSYILPRGWFYHGLRVANKYELDQKWIGRVNIEGEYAVAYHGTRGQIIQKVQSAVRPNSVYQNTTKNQNRNENDEASQQMGVYVTTHCDGGAFPTYTQRFTVTTSPDYQEHFIMVFQCRVLWLKSTSHVGLTEQGRALHFIDPHYIRPHGIVLRKDDES